ncbi:hypothetical protein [Peribacillus sp. FSL H8-0477]|uniref:hypothetical protein n=1 Tax=Peribacillus sp. FSL H8-0477 TaxID=2921388 RepID=UPI0040469F40
MYNPYKQDTNDLNQQTMYDSYGINSEINPDYSRQKTMPGGPGSAFPPPRPPGGPGSGGAPGGGPPSAPPPQFVPDFPGVSAFAVDAGALQGCLFRNTYVWLNNGRSFWFFPVFIGRRSVAGFRWRAGQRRWVYYGIDTSNIRSFQC